MLKVPPDGGDNRELKQATFWKRKPEADVSHARLLVSPRFLNFLIGKQLTSGCRPWLKNVACLSSLISELLHLFVWLVWLACYNKLSFLFKEKLPFGGLSDVYLNGIWFVPCMHVRNQQLKEWNKEHRSVSPSAQDPSV